MQRHRVPPAIAATPREQVADIHYKEIDSFLRDLKGCSRRLKVAMDSFMDESRILERLYYKSKNQHRMILYFKRVVEIRRYGQRLEELDVPNCVDLLRASFVGLAGTKDRKALKSSWSHVPQESYVNHVLDRLMSCSTLVCKMRERVEGAYHHFSLAMQSGAFIQLLILFAAICSRMSRLSSEIEDALHSSASAITRLLLILNPTNKLTAVIPSVQEPPIEPDSSQALEQLTEDIGQILSRFDHPDTLGPEPVSHQAEEIGLRTRITPPPCFSSTVVVDHAAAVSEQASARVTQKPRLKRSKKRRDEIDEIFGF